MNNDANLTAEERLCREVEEDFKLRQSERREYERAWQLNLNFNAGKQYCGLDLYGEICEYPKTYEWEQRRVFNHIAPVVDTRLSKLSRVRPVLAVRAASSDERDRRSAFIASSILSCVQEDGDWDGVISEACAWSETCGTAFYKIIWDERSGKVVGAKEDGGKLSEGDVRLAAVSPFEIYPYSLYIEDIRMQPSIIHAKAVPVDDIFEMYGVRLAGSDIRGISRDLLHRTADNGSGSNAGLKTGSNAGSGSGSIKSGAGNNANAGSSAREKAGYGDGAVGGDGRNYEKVIERYEKPDSTRPNGRLTIVAGGKLLFDGDLPYVNGSNGTREYPFVKQTSFPSPGKFFGSSVIERLIPIQRAYNAVKNRKHEFLNRISMGTVAVEEGSVDCDELAEDGLAPGKIIVYRQGCTPPSMLSLGSVPDEFYREEEKLLKEFSGISGTNGFSDDAASFAGITSATGLQLIIEQDDARLNTAYASLKRAVKEAGRQALRLYKQFAGEVRLLKFSNGGDQKAPVLFKGSDISSDDVVLEADSELNMTPAQKRTVIYELMDRGLFKEGGDMTASARKKLLTALGYPTLAPERDVEELHRARARSENDAMKKGERAVKEYDDHAAHIEEHTAFLLSEELEKGAEERISNHIKEHERMLKGEENY